jgi:hypothetical protein
MDKGRNLKKSLNKAKEMLDEAEQEVNRIELLHPGAEL